MKDKQFFKLPNKMGIEGLNPKDQLVYVCLRSHMNNDSYECFVSLQTLAQELRCSINTVRSSISRLLEKDYISVRREGRKNIYKFNPETDFQPFSPEFLNNDKISFEVKAFLTASQQYMIKDVEGYGKVSFTNVELAEKIGTSEKSVRRYNQELERNNLMMTLQNVSRDLETGCNTNTKVYRLKDLGQAIVWKVQEHEDRLNNTDFEIAELKKQVEEQKKLIDKLFIKLDAQNVKQEFKI